MIDSLFTMQISIGVAYLAYMNWNSSKLLAQMTGTKRKQQSAIYLAVFIIEMLTFIFAVGMFTFRLLQHLF